MVVRPIVVGNNFKRVLDIRRIKIRHLKSENQWENSGSLDSNKTNIEGFKGTNELFQDRIWHFPQRKSLSKCQQLTNEAYTSSLGLPEAFCSVFWIKRERELHV